MTWELRWSPRAARDLEQIQRHSPQAAQRIYQTATAYASTGHGDVVKLNGQGGVYRLRVGDWRMIFTFQDGGLVILALRVLNRRDAYR